MVHVHYSLVSHGSHVRKCIRLKNVIWKTLTWLSIEDRLSVLLAVLNYNSGSSWPIFKHLGTKKMTTCTYSNLPILDNWESLHVRNLFSFLIQLFYRLHYGFNHHRMHMPEHIPSGVNTVKICKSLFFVSKVTRPTFKVQPSIYVYIFISEINLNYLYIISDVSVEVRTVKNVYCQLQVEANAKRETYTFSILQVLHVGICKLLNLIVWSLNCEQDLVNFHFKMRKTNNFVGSQDSTQ